MRCHVIAVLLNGRYRLEKLCLDNFFAIAGDLNPNNQAVALTLGADLSIRILPMRL
jgi:hypothetical protein